MRRNRSALLNIVLFSLALTIILYLNLSAGSSNKIFAWNTIRYKYSAEALPVSRGVCPGLSDRTTKPVLVIARVTKEPISAFDDLASQYHLCPYTADAVEDVDSIHLQTPANRGHEAMAYLTFIIDNYRKLPDTGLVFVHGSRFAWHNDDPLYDNVSLLKQLNVSRALWGPPGPATGYSNMRCDWSAGMCDASRDDTKPQGSIESRTRAMLEHGNARAASDVALVAALSAIFGHNEHEGSAATIRGSSIRDGTKPQAKVQTTLGRSDAVRSQCCAQFVVARQNIWRHSRDEYVALRQWLLDGSSEQRAALAARVLRGQKVSQDQVQKRWLDISAPADDLIAGRVLSYIWHILFLPSDLPSNGEQPTVPRQEDVSGVNLDLLNRLACPRADECYCRLYGRCDLAGCKNPGRCVGQYRLPPGYKLPSDWAEKHS